MAVPGGTSQRRRQKSARRLGWRPWSPPLLSLPLLLLLFSGSRWWRWVWMGRREAGWGLGSYRWSARVWSPKGTAGILGVHAQGHAAHIPRCRRSGAAAMAARRPAPTMPSRGRLRKGKKTGKGADRWGPPVTGCGILGRWELGCGLRWAERPNGLAI
jgi:hypothetical protein